MALPSQLIGKESSLCAKPVAWLVVKYARSPVLVSVRWLPFHPIQTCMDKINLRSCDVMICGADTYRE